MNKHNDLRIILASASPRRRELLTQIGLSFEIITADVEEHAQSSSPGEIVEELSAIKAGAVLDMLISESGKTTTGKENAESFGGDLLIIGADTIVACDGKILGKPADDREACVMLELLQGRAHQVYTGVTLYKYSARDRVTECRQFHEKTDVIFSAMSEEEIKAYVTTGDPLDKAGSYGIQGLCARYIRGIQGDYNNVVGLPVGRLYQEMKGYLQV